MNIRFFFVKDRVASREIRIEYCPTKEMVADFFTKPLQGSQFYKLRDQIMNIDPNNKYHSDHRSVLRKKNDDDKKTKATVVPKEATGKDGRANQVDVATRSYLEAATRAGE